MIRVYRVLATFDGVPDITSIMRDGALSVAIVYDVCGPEMSALLVAAVSEDEAGLLFEAMILDAGATKADCVMVAHATAIESHAQALAAEMWAAARGVS